MKAPAALRFLLLMYSGWVSRHQQDLIEYLRTENRVLREQLGGKRLRLTDDQRRRLAVRGKMLGRRVLGDVACIVTPDTILRWYRKLVAQKYDGSRRRGLVARAEASRSNGSWCGWRTRTGAGDTPESAIQCIASATR